MDKKLNKSKRSRSFILVLIIIIAGGFFISEFMKKPGLESEILTIGTSNSLNSVLLTIADEKGFFKKEGISVVLKWYKSAGNALDDMLAGNIHMAGVSETPIMYKSFYRDDFKIFATICTNSNDPKIIMISDKGRPQVSDLTGKIIGTTKKGQSAHFFLYLFLLKHGIGEDNVTLIHDSPAQIVDRLVKGDIHAASLFEPYAAYAKNLIKEKAFVFEESGLYSKTYNLVAKTNYLNTHNETNKRILKALIAAEKFHLDFPEQFLEIIYRRHKIKKNNIKNYLSNSSMEVSLPGSLLFTLRDEAKWAIQSKLTDKIKIPDFSNIIFTDSLNAVRPESMTFKKQETPGK